MATLSNPYFWAMLSLLGMLGANAIVSGSKIGASKTYGMAIIALVLIPRFIVALPFVEQSRFQIPFQLYIGLTPIFLGFCFWIPLYKIMWSTQPDQSETLSTSGVFGIVRHPGYFGDILIILGWSILFGSWVGVALTAVWVAAFYFHALIEENSLLSAYGKAYELYQLKVRSRIIPGVPF